MKVITEAVLRDELRREQPDTYYIPEGKILSPAAREYLQQRKIKISKEPAPEMTKSEPSPGHSSDPSQMQESSAAGRASGALADSPRQESSAASRMCGASLHCPEAAKKPGLRFVDEQTGAYYMEKPEHMTQLHGNTLVPKDHPRIVFRGKLDSLQSMIVLAQVQIAERGKEKLAEELEDILVMLREMMRVDALELPFQKDLIIGFTHAELRDRSHDPKKYYQLEPMLLPHYRMGLEYALLNQLRSAVRETETAAIAAFQNQRNMTRSDIVEGLNRLSSAVHVMMCRYLAGEYGSGARKR